MVLFELAEAGKRDEVKKKRGLPFLNQATVHCGDVGQLEGTFVRAATGINKGGGKGHV